MSKSNPDSAIFMEDSAKDVEKKIKKAFCKEKVIERNPIMDYCKNIIFGLRSKLEIVRKPEHGGNRTYNSYEELTKEYEEGLLHPDDLKTAVAKVINELIEPVRKHFETDPQAKALINKIKSFKKEAPKE